MSIHIDEEGFYIKSKRTPIVKGEDNRIPFEGTAEDLLMMRAFIICLKVELMMYWQGFNRGKPDEEILKWNPEE